MDRFTWVDGERTIRFGRGVAAEAVALAGGAGYTLLTTGRAQAILPDVVAAAGVVHHVASGPVDVLGGDLLERVGDGRLVALGGGRVIDVAKALAAGIGGGASVTAIPTTLSGAELTTGHRHARGVDESTPRVRARAVVYDPALAASQPVAALAASALNALGHAAEGPCTVRANPVAILAAREAARLLDAGFAGEAPDRDTLALGALLAGYAIDSTGLGLHHVLAQTLVRELGVGHAPANALLLGHTLEALRRRFGTRVDGFAEVAARLLPFTGLTGLADLGVDAGALPAAAEAAARRPQLANTPPAADADEILAVYRAAL